MSDTSITAEEQVARLERELARAREENRVLDGMIEEKTRGLYLAHAAAERSRAFLESILGAMQSALFITDPYGFVTTIGGTATQLTTFEEEELMGIPIDAVMWPAEGQPPGEYELTSAGGAPLPVLVTISELIDDQGELMGRVHVASDLRERRALEIELRHAHRLESIGELAAGVAHEINTPLQFVSDSARFLGEMITDLLELLDQHEELRQAAAGHDALADRSEAIEALAEEIDVEFLREESPGAVKRTLDGLQRVTSIVQAMKQFSHPGSDDLAPVDLADLVESTVTVARNEFKYVADIEVADDLPEVYANRGDLGQVMLNLVVNAAHAIADQVDGTDELGRIAISAARDGEGVMVSVADTGGGIPFGIRERIFEPFFTTKEPGKGSGQGLALVYNVIVNSHHGRLSFDVEDGVGTTFHLWLPDRDAAAATTEEA
ncbi:MAG: ATP-binding protein [Actinomycetota bacterium]